MFCSSIVHRLDESVRFLGLVVSEQNQPQPGDGFTVLRAEEAGGRITKADEMESTEIWLGGNYGA